METRKTNKLFAVDCTFPLALFGELLVFLLLPTNHQGGGGLVGERLEIATCMHIYMGLVPLDSRVMVRAVLNKGHFARFSRNSVLEKIIIFYSPNCRKFTSRRNIEEGFAAYKQQRLPTR